MIIDLEHRRNIARALRKQAATGDCQGERRTVPLNGVTHQMFEAAANPRGSAAWGRGMLRSALMAIEYGEDREAAQAELAKLFVEYTS